MGLQNCYPGLLKFSKLKIYDNFFRKKSFWKYFQKIWIFQKHRKFVQDILKASSCSNFQLATAELSTFSFFQYTGYIVLKNLNACFDMF